MSGLARNINGNPENPQERSWLLLSPQKDEKAGGRETGRLLE